MRPVAFGTAQLFGSAGPESSRALLLQAWESGIRRFDTAPSYGAGQAEPELGAFLSSHTGAFLTSKTGLLPALQPDSKRRWAKRGAALLPETLRQRVRAARRPVSGSFGLEEVHRSLTTSLRRLGRLDRLMLHEIDPVDLSDELLAALAHYVDNGDVAAVGVATGNDRTATALFRAPGLLTVAHIEAGPLSDPLVLPDAVTVIGHGLLGPGGDHLRRLRRRLQDDPAAATSWQEAVAGTVYADQPRLDGASGGRGAREPAQFAGLAQALLARPSPTPLEEVIIATTRPAAVLPALQAVTGPPLPAVLADLLDRVVMAAAAS